MYKTLLKCQSEKKKRHFRYKISYSSCNHLFKLIERFVHTVRRQAKTTSPKAPPKSAIHDEAANLLLASPLQNE